MMKCTMGTSPAKLTVLPTRTIYLARQPQANISDHQSMVNLAPFGLCRSLAFPPTAAATAAALGTLTPMPCMHNTPAPWFVGKMDTLLQGQPALLKSCKCQCMWGGTISLVTDGQVGEGTQYVTKKPKISFKQTPSQFISYDLEDSGIENLGAESPNNSGSRQTSTAKQPVAKKKKEPSTPEEIVEHKRVSKIVLKRFEGLSQEDKQRIVSMAKELPDNLNNLEKLAIAERSFRLEKAIGKKKGKRMTIEQADMEKANPHNHKYFVDPKGKYVDTKNVHYSKNPDYHSSDDRFKINCATVAPTYALRLLGFDIKAKGRTKGSGSLNDWVSKGNSFKLWQNIDGTPAKPELTTDWMKKKGYQRMDKQKYIEYFEETCSEEGVYVITIKWKDKQIAGSHGETVTKNMGAHATILQRDRDGNLYYIEPQTYSSSAGVKRPISQLAENGTPDPKLMTGKGIMRVDNKLFDTRYTSLFDS